MNSTPAYKQHLTCTFINSLLLASTLLLTACGGSSSSSNSNNFSDSDCEPENNNVTFTLNEDKTSAEMNGVIDCTITEKVSKLLENKTLTTIVMKDVPGSADDEKNLAAAGKVHEAGLNIHLDGKIASGGVDFFLAGTVRTIADNSIVAVHSWADGSGVQGIELYSRNPDDKTHQEYIKYFQKVGFTEQEATDFYVYTLRAADADHTHCMSAEELRQYKVVTGDQLDGTTELNPTTEDNEEYCNSYINQPVPM